MKSSVLFFLILMPICTRADLFDVDPASLCELFTNQGIVTTRYGPASDPNAKLCYIPKNHKSPDGDGYVLSYRVLGHWKWNELTGGVFISVRGIESKLIADDMLSKYKKMAYVLIDKVTADTHKKEISNIVSSILSKSNTYQSVEAMSISSYSSRQDYDGQTLVEYRLDITNQCMYHPTHPGRDECIAKRIRESNK